MVGTPLTILIKFSRSRSLIDEKWWNEGGKGEAKAANNSLPSFSSIHPLPPGSLLKNPSGYIFGLFSKDFPPPLN